MDEICLTQFYWQNKVYLQVFHHCSNKAIQNSIVKIFYKFTLSTLQLLRPHSYLSSFKGIVNLKSQFILSKLGVRLINKNTGC